MCPLCQWLRDRLHLYRTLPPQDIELRNTSRLSGQHRPTTLLHQSTMLKLICALLLKLLMTFLHKAKCINHIFPIAQTRDSRPTPGSDLNNLNLNRNRNPPTRFLILVSIEAKVLQTNTLKYEALNGVLRLWWIVSSWFILLAQMATIWSTTYKSANNRGYYYKWY